MAVRLIDLVLKQCTQCYSLKIRLKHISTLPKDDFGFCSIRCIFLWMLINRFKYNDNYVIELNKNGKTYKIQDYLSKDEMQRLNPYKHA